MTKDFRWLLVGQTTSQFGAQVSGVAVPLLAVLTLGATPFQLGPDLGVEHDRVRTDRSAGRGLGGPAAPAAPAGGE